jgi:hypothetical protein
VSAKKKRTGPNRRTTTPEWMQRYLEDRTVPPEGTPERDEYNAWTLMPGYSDYFGLGWPDPPEGMFPNWPPK